MKKPSLIIGLGAGPKEPSESEDLTSSEKTAAASALRSALKGGNPEEIAEAFEAMLDACSGDDYAAEEESEDTEDEM